MSRPKKERHVCFLPRNARFGPLGQQSGRRGTVVMTVDEYETIRLIDKLGLTQEECALQMQVARTTVQSIYSQARKKLAASLVDGVTLNISGGEYTLCSKQDDSCRRGHCRQHGRRKGAAAELAEEPQEQETD